MNIHEYQARELFAKFGVATRPGGAALTPEEAEQVATKLGGKIVVKAQIHAGWTRQGNLQERLQGRRASLRHPGRSQGPRFPRCSARCSSHQTGPDGKEVGKVFVGEAVDIKRELYFAILLDRATSAPVVIASTEGGVDIEFVAEHTPEKILRLCNGGIPPWASCLTRRARSPRCSASPASS